MTTSDFAAITRESFGFLEQHSFVYSWDGRYRVRFDSPKVFVTVVYDATRSYELGTQIGLQAGIEHDVECSFEIWEILRVVGHGELPEAKSVIQSRASDVRKYIERLADLVRQYASKLLAGDIELFKALDRQRDADTAAYALKTTLSYARQNAEKAWKQGRYGEVVKELELVAEYLSPSEQKRLDIARKRAKALGSED